MTPRFVTHCGFILDCAATTLVNTEGAVMVEATYLADGARGVVELEGKSYEISVKVKE